MDKINLLDSLHTKILHSKLAETITEQEIDALINRKEQMKEKELNQKEVVELYEKNQEFREFADHIATMTDTAVEVVLEWAAIKSVAQTMKG